MRPNMSRRAERGKPLSSPRQPRLTLARSPRYGPPVSPPCRCLVLDHDDTVVDSSPVIHYAAHVESLRAAPGMAPVDLDGWFLRTSTPASGATREELGLSDDEMTTEYAIWRRCRRRWIARFFRASFETLHDF